MHVLLTSPALALVAFGLALPAQAASWQAIATNNGGRVDIDKSRIMRTGPGQTLAWSRLVFGRELTDGQGNYTAVQAMNRYDCAGHRFVTLKRIYMNGERVVREEKVASPREMAAELGSIDGQLLAEACKARTVGEAQRVAEEAGRIASQAQEGKASVMYADVRAVAEPVKPKVLPVAGEHKPEAKAEIKPEPRAEVKAEPKAPPPPAERPRYIDLPKIDKSQIEEPKPGVAKPGEKVAEKPLDKAPAASRQELERQYATSGPRKTAVRRKPAETMAEQALLEHRHIHWSYEGEGAPANWSKLRPDYATCASGRRQSPIDIREGIRVDLEPIAIDYKLSQFRIVDNGHTIQASVGEGSTISVMGRSYQLLQLHFHKPSEERVNGRAFDMVAHLVHRDDEGHLAVLAVLLEKGAEHPVIQTLWNHLPLEVDQELLPAVAIDLNRLLPENRAYYTYMGSLTTPPCTEGVLWLVLKQPVQVSPEQVAIFSRLYRHNARPIQPGFGRLIKESR